MKGFLLGLGVLVILFVVLCLGGVGYCFHVFNSEATLRNKAGAQQKANEATFDNTWKTISQVAQVNDEYKEDFRKSWKEILEAQNGGQRASMMTATMTKINPKFDSSLSKKVMTVVEGSRKEFLNGQTKLIDIKREHDNLRTTLPAKWLVGDKPELAIVVVTSGRTNDSFESGKDDDVSLRPTQKK